MTNLLLEEDRKDIRRDYVLRLGATAAGFLGVFALMSTVFLVPSFALSISKEGSLRERVELLARTTILRSEDPSLLALSDFNGGLQFLSSRQERQLTNAVLLRVLEAKPSGVSITRLSFARHLDGSADIAIGGLARTREALLFFERRLRDDTLFSDIVLPVSNLANDKDIEFSMTAQGAF